MQAAHPLRVSGGEVVVGRDHVNTLAIKRVEVDRQRRDQGFSLTSLHLSDPAEVQRHAAHDLHVEVTLTEHPPCGFSDHGERLDQQVVKRLALSDALLELNCLGLELLIAERLHSGLELIDQRDELGESPNLLALTGAQDL